MGCQCKSGKLIITGCVWEEAEVSVVVLGGGGVVSDYYGISNWGWMKSGYYGMSVGDGE